MVASVHRTFFNIFKASLVRLLGDHNGDLKCTLGGPGGGFK
uniref:Uncharacterized protein n=1 Tax=Vitis vinifera TaxID=29760 RepID=F6H9D8_VITVI